MKRIKGLIIQKTENKENINLDNIAFNGNQPLTYHNICSWNSEKLKQCLQVRLTILMFFDLYHTTKYLFLVIL